VLAVAGGYLALVVLLPGRALGEGEGLAAVQARLGECRERGVAGALVGGVQVFGRGVAGRLVDGAPLLVRRAVGGPQVLASLVLVHVTSPWLLVVAGAGGGGAGHGGQLPFAGRGAGRAARPGRVTR
jgi:hypothetical protein